MAARKYAQESAVNAVIGSITSAHEASPWALHELNQSYDGSTDITFKVGVVPRDGNDTRILVHINIKQDTEDD